MVRKYEGKYDKEYCLMPRGGARVQVISDNLILETKSRENILSPLTASLHLFPYVVSRDLSMLSIEQMITASYKPTFL